MKKVVILGDGGVGKSALAISLTQNYFVTEYDPTIENSYRKQLEYDGTVQMIDILDTAGQEDYSVMRDQYINSGDGFLLVYSVASKVSFKGVKELYNRILHVREASTWPVVIAANKCDLPANKREVTKEQGEQLARDIGCSFFETSAKERLNVEEAFRSLAQRIDKAMEPVKAAEREKAAAAAQSDTKRPRASTGSGTKPASASGGCIIL